MAPGRCGPIPSPPFPAIIPPQAPTPGPQIASFEKRAGKIRAQVKRLGQRDSATFWTLAEAKAWAKSKEREIAFGEPARGTVGTLFTRYAAEVSPTKRGAKWEIIRLRLLTTQPLASVPLVALRPAHIAAWRDERLKSVSGASVRREHNLLHSVFEVARREWGMIPTNPTKDVRAPPSPPHRRRRITDEELETLLFELDYPGTESIRQRVGCALVLAIETGMRAGELCGLSWADVGEKSVTLPRTKNGSERSVPLSGKARAVIASLREQNGPYVLGLRTAQLDVMFRQARERAGIVDLHFHDSRAEACTRLAKKLDVMQLARMIGHRDLKSLMIYFRESADDIADRL